MTDEYKVILFACGAVALVLFWIIVNARRHVAGRPWTKKEKLNRVYLR